MSDKLTQEMIIHAWKSPSYRASLSDEQRAMLPESPSGRAMNELEENELSAVTGGQIIIIIRSTSGACQQCC